MEEYKCEILIIGAGPAGLSAAVYCGRAGRNTIVLDGKEPSALYRAKDIQNYLGFKQASGFEMLKKFIEHAKEYESIKIIKGDVISLMIGMGTNMISTRTANITADAIIIATGGGQRKEKITGEDKLMGYGVSYCALCDGPLYREKIVYLYGSDEEVIEDALVLDQMGCIVKLISNSSLKDLPKDIEKLQAKDIEIIDNTEIIEVVSNDRGTIEYISCKKKDSEELMEFKLDCLFILSHIPTNTMFKKAGVELDDKGNIKVDEEQQTNIQGVYAAGDVTGGLFQVAFAVAEGARAGINVSKYIRSLQ
ncbi:MAG: FAD-dependent oxidoreductase [Candidatus Lokiarchaeota archaeon]|nr:FAD-dependent oxidoreductase [Candidatus Lokiarchaeota archaeon]